MYILIQEGEVVVKIFIWIILGTGLFLLLLAVSMILFLFWFAVFSNWLDRREEKRELEMRTYYAEHGRFF